MDPTFTASIELDDGTSVLGQVMYVIVWEGKALSGSEVLVRGDAITRFDVSPLP